MKILVILLGLLLPSIVFAAPPRILATIKPIQALVAGVTEGITEPDVLVTKNASPHSYSLRPSDAEKLQKADMIFMVGHDFELFLEKPLAHSTASVVQLANLYGIKKLPLRKDTLWADGDDDDDRGQIDLHLWLDPNNAIAIVTQIAELLSARDAEHAAHYRQNAAKMVIEIQQLDKEITSKLAPYSEVSYLVSHDAYQYFEAHYQLHAVGAVMLSPDKTPGAKTMKTLEDSVTRHHAVCIFSEPQFPTEYAQSIANSTGIGIGVLDPEWGAAEGDKGKAAYFSLMRGLTKSLIECFDKKRSLMS